MAARKARINFQGLIRDEKLTSSVKQVAVSSVAPPQRQTGGRCSFREIQLSDSEDDNEVDDETDFDHSRKLEGATPDDTSTSAPQQLLRLSLRNARLNFNQTNST